MNNSTQRRGRAVKSSLRFYQPEKLETDEDRGRVYEWGKKNSSLLAYGDDDDYDDLSSDPNKYDVITPGYDANNQ